MSPNGGVRVAQYRWSELLLFSFYLAQQTIPRCPFKPTGVEKCRELGVARMEDWGWWMVIVCKNIISLLLPLCSFARTLISYAYL